VLRGLTALTGYHSSGLRAVFLARWQQTRLCSLIPGL
jgi:hypothetical protein